MKKKQLFILILLLVVSNCFSQWKTNEVNNIKNDIVISYEVIYEKELSLDEKNSSEYVSEITIAFNKDNMTERRFGNKPKTTNNFSLFNFNTLKAYSCAVLGNIKKAVEFEFKAPTVTVEPIENTDLKIILDFPCEKGLTTINKTPKEIFYTKKIGLRYCRQFKIDGFLMEYPGYSKSLGFYTVKAKKITYDDFPDSFYSLTDFNIQTAEDLKKNIAESQKKKNEIRMQFIGKKAKTFNEISIKQNKIDTKKIIGDVIVYNFWFTNCGPCKAEIPKLNELKQKYNGKNIHFISIALDPEYKIIPFLKTFPFEYEIIPEGRWISEMFNVNSYPTNIIVDKNGIIQFYDIGYKTDIVDRMASTLDKYLE